MEAQNPTALHAELPALLPEWLPQQRWFAAKGRSVASVAVAAHTPLLTGGDPLLGLGVWQVDLIDDGDDRQVVFEGGVEVGEGLRLHSLGGIDD